jgi:hypothetical protein
MRFSRRGELKVLRIFFPLLISCLFSAQPLPQSHAQSMASATRSDEFDTADRQGGQIGGARMGIHYQLVTMRCGSKEVMVGANIRRRDALNYMQIACATPSCVNTSCTWLSPHWGMSAGSAAGGDAHPAMMCRSNEILSGIRGRVLVFAGRTSFDYAADIEIECSQMKSAPVMGSSGQQLYPISIPGSTGSWHHSDGSFSSAPPGPREVIESNITGPISCSPRGYGATAVSVGVSAFFEGLPAVQAVSLYCPRIPATAHPQSPPRVASTVKRKQGGGSATSQSSSLDFGSTVETKPASASTASKQPSLFTASASVGANDFRLMTPEDSMWANQDYAGTLGYFAGKSNAPSSCHGFIGEMGVATPGADLCGNEFLRNLPHLPPGTAHQSGDVAIVPGRIAKEPWHSAIFIGCALYLQRNGGSNIQVISQSYIDNFTSNEQVYYVRPIGLGTFKAKVAAIKATINPGEGTTAANQAAIAQIKGCFPN